MSAVQVFENTVGKGEIVRDEQFLLFSKCFLSFLITFCIFVKLKNVACKLFQFGRVYLKLVVWERVHTTASHSTETSILCTDGNTDNGQTPGQTHGQTDRLILVYPRKHSLCRGIKMPLLLRFEKKKGQSIVISWQKHRKKSCIMDRDRSTAI